MGVVLFLIGLIVFRVELWMIFGEGTTFFLGCTGCLRGVTSSATPSTKDLVSIEMGRSSVSSFGLFCSIYLIAVFGLGLLFDCCFLTLDCIVGVLACLILKSVVVWLKGSSPCKNRFSLDDALSSLFLLYNSCFNWVLLHPRRGVHKLSSSFLI